MTPDPDAQLLKFLEDNGATAATVNGKFVVLDLGAIGPTLGDYSEALVESLRHVEVLTVANTTLRTLDLSGLSKLRELRLGGANRELQINVSECADLRSITVLPRVAGAEEYETLVLCRLEQLTPQAAAAMETERTPSDGLLRIRFEFVDGSECSGIKKVRAVTGEMLTWLSRHPTTDLATILASYWHEDPWFWAQYDDANLAHDRRTFERLRDIESRVASGFYVSQAHAFDVRDHAWKHVASEKPSDAAVVREIPPCMFVFPYTATPPGDEELQQQLVRAAEARRERPFDPMPVREERRLRGLYARSLRGIVRGISADRFEDGVLRAVRLDRAPAALLAQLEHPLLCTVEEVRLAFSEADLDAWLAGPALPRPLSIAHLSFSVMGLAHVAKVVARFSECRELTLDIRMKGAKDTSVFETLQLPQLETLYVRCDASEAWLHRLMAGFLGCDAPNLRRVSVRARGTSKSGIALDKLLKILPAGVTELGVWTENREECPVTRELLDSDVLSRLKAVGVTPGLIADSRLAGKRLFGPQTDSSVMTNLAIDLYAAGRVEDGIAYLGPQRWQTSYGDLWSQYALMLSQVDRKRGLSAYYDALERAPADAVAGHNLGHDLVAEGHFEAAFPWLTRAVSDFPDNAWMPRGLALVWRARGDAARASLWAERFLALARAAVAKDPDADALYELACAHVWQDDLDQALAYLRRAVKGGVAREKVAEDWEWSQLQADPRLLAIVEVRPS